MESVIWRAAERLLRAYGDLAEQECNARISYYEMTWNPAAAKLWRRRREFVLRLKSGERPPLRLSDAVIAGRFHDFLTEQEAKGVKAASLESEVTEVIRKLVRTRLRELGAHPA